MHYFTYDTSEYRLIEKTLVISHNGKKPYLEIYENLNQIQIEQVKRNSFPYPERGENYSCYTPNSAYATNKNPERAKYIAAQFGVSYIGGATRNGGDMYPDRSHSKPHYL